MKQKFYISESEQNDTSQVSARESVLEMSSHILSVLCIMYPAKPR